MGFEIRELFLSLHLLIWGFFLFFQDSISPIHNQKTIQISFFQTRNLIPKRINH